MLVAAGCRYSYEISDDLSGSGQPVGASRGNQEVDASGNIETPLQFDAGIPIGSAGVPSVGGSSGGTAGETAAGGASAGSSSGSAGGMVSSGGSAGDPSGGENSGGSAGSGEGGDAQGGTGEGGAAGSPPDSCTPVPAGPGRDADGDGIVDALDPDDDNDGQSDLFECFPGATRLVNPGFESPLVTRPDRDWEYISTSSVPGWNNNSGQMEFWKSGNFGVESAEGNQFIELSAQEFDIAWQTFNSVPGTTLRWAFWHRARAGDNAVELLIGKPGEPLMSQGTFTTSTSWQLYEGTVTIPQGQTLTRIEFVHILPSDSESGNFMDHIDVEPICTVDTDGDGCVDTEDPD